MPLRLTFSDNTSEFGKRHLGSLGQGVFTTIGSVRISARSSVAQAKGLTTEAAFFRLTDHLARVYRHGTILGLVEIGEREFSSLVCNELRKNISTISEDILSGQVTSVIKIAVSEGEIGVLLSSYTPSWNRDAVVDLHPVEGVRYLPELKTINSLVSVCARKVALENGAHEALLIDNEGFIREGAWSNFFWFSKTGELKTVGEKVLPGILRGAILGWERVQFASLKLVEVPQEVAGGFITQSTTGITPIGRIGSHVFTSQFEATSAIVSSVRERVLSEAVPLFEI